MTTRATRTITIPHLGRVEGHGGIVVTVRGRQVVDVDMNIHEGSRYYEALLVGKHFREVQGIITRVCAICSAHHSVAALTALEDALGVSVSERVRLLRDLLVNGGNIESHALHVFALALPDYLGFDSVISMAADYPGEVAFALRLKQLGNTIQAFVGGRSIHPINTLVGGFGTLPTHAEIRAIRAQIETALAPLMDFVATAATIEVPAWAAQPTTYMALRPFEDGFRMRGTTLCTARGGVITHEIPVHDYRDAIREYTVEHSHAKHAALSTGDTYMVGSLARLHLWGDRLQGRAREAFQRLFPNGPQDNILLNNWAQLTELVFSIERAMAICDRLLELDETFKEIAPFEVRAGRGVGAIEVPRGTLIHDYELDERGMVVSANVITPTAQNLANTERDMRQAAEQLLASSERDDDTLKLHLEMVARAYDPCISCSVHVVRADT